MRRAGNGFVRGIEGGGEMRLNRLSANDVKCPFFSKQTANAIYCEGGCFAKRYGVLSDAVHFANREGKDVYMDSKCRSSTGYRKCIKAKMYEKFYGGEW